jgi:hypothetical protein
MDECRRQRGKRESGELVATARQNSLSWPNASRRRSRAYCKASDSRHAAASGRPVVNGV